MDGTGGAVSLVAAILIALVVAAWLISKWRGPTLPDRGSEVEAPEPEREYARIVETFEAGRGGAFAGYMLIATLIGAPIWWFMAQDAFGRIGAGIGLIAGILLWGGAAVLSRRRIFLVYKRAPDDAASAFDPRSNFKR